MAASDETGAAYSLRIDHEYVVNLPSRIQHDRLKSSTGWQWERHENDEDELPQFEQRVHRKLVGKLLRIIG